MNKKLLLLGSVIALLASNSYALTAQQEKMKTCNADAKTQGLKGDERKAFMKNCLSKKPATTPAAPAAASAPTTSPAVTPAPAAAAPASATPATPTKP
jgi:hypothetical protein